MSLPITLQYGYVAVYGLGYETSISGIVPTNSEWKFGDIYQISLYGINPQYAGSFVGCHVAFRESEAQLAIQWVDASYTIIEQGKLAGFSENDAPPAL